MIGVHVHTSFNSITQHIIVNLDELKYLSSPLNSNLFQHSATLSVREYLLTAYISDRAHLSCVFVVL